MHLNRGICEQTFSWLKNYNSSLDDMRENRHKFMIAYLAKKNHDSTDEEHPAYPHPHAKKPSQQAKVQKKSSKNFYKWGW